MCNRSMAFTLPQSSVFFPEVFFTYSNPKMATALSQTDGDTGSWQLGWCWMPGFLAEGAVVFAGAWLSTAEGGKAAT